jgi:hypothetical protein
MDDSKWSAVSSDAGTLRHLYIKTTDPQESNIKKYSINNSIQGKINVAKLRERYQISV